MPTKPPFNPWQRYAAHPDVGRTGLPRIKREWIGDRVCVHFMQSRGHAYKRTRMGYKWGVLVSADADHLVAVALTNPDGSFVDGGEVAQIHYRRIQTVWNLSRKIPLDAEPQEG